jgi:hypothetical protein
MDEKGHTFEEVGKMVGVTGVAVGDWYRGNHLPFTRNLEGITRYINGQNPPKQQALPLQSNGEVTATRVEDSLSLYLIRDKGKVAH